MKDEQPDAEQGIDGVLKAVMADCLKERDEPAVVDAARALHIAMVGCLDNPQVLNRLLTHIGRSVASAFGAISKECDEEFACALFNKWLEWVDDISEGAIHKDGAGEIIKQAFKHHMVH